LAGFALGNDPLASPKYVVIPIISSEVHNGSWDSPFKLILTPLVLREAVARDRERLTATEVIRPRKTSGREGLKRHRSPGMWIAQKKTAFASATQRGRLFASPQIASAFRTDARY
jgi:hypothetical protein